MKGTKGSKLENKAKIRNIMAHYKFNRVSKRCRRSYISKSILTSKISLTYYLLIQTSLDHRNNSPLRKKIW